MNGLLREAAVQVLNGKSITELGCLVQLQLPTLIDSTTLTVAENYSGPTVNSLGLTVHATEQQFSSSTINNNGNSIHTDAMVDTQPVVPTLQQSVPPTIVTMPTFTSFQVALPPIKLLVFPGDNLQYATFLELFKALIDCQPISEVAKFHYINLSTYRNFILPPLFFPEAPTHGRVGDVCSKTEEKENNLLYNFLCGIVTTVLLKETLHFEGKHQTARLYEKLMEVFIILLSFVSMVLQCRVREAFRHWFRHFHRSSVLLPREADRHEHPSLPDDASRQHGQMEPNFTGPFINSCFSSGVSRSSILDRDCYCSHRNPGVAINGGLRRGSKTPQSTHNSEYISIRDLIFECQNKNM